MNSNAFCVNELTVSCCFLFFVAVVLATAAFLFCSDIETRGLSFIICSRLVPFEDYCTMPKYFCTTC